MGKQKKNLKFRLKTICKKKQAYEQLCALIKYKQWQTIITIINLKFILNYFFLRSGTIFFQKKKKKKFDLFKFQSKKSNFKIINV